MRLRKNDFYKYSEVIEYIAENGYYILSDESAFVYSYKSLLTLQCSKNHEWKTTFTNFKVGVRCLECSGNKKISFTYIKNEFEKDNYIVLTKEENFETQVKTKIDFICPNGHKHNISFRKWKKGRRCAKCGVSTEENLLNLYLEEIYSGMYERNDRNTILNPNTGHYLELDFYFPDINKAIELNGEYWHSKEERKNNDYIKKEECIKHNIDLLVISDKEWNKNNIQIKEKIYNFLN